MTSGNAPRLAALLLVVGLAAAACGGDDNNASADGGGSTKLSGTIRVDGSSTVGPLSETAAELFREEQ